MPWKFEKNPYKIWLSEIILQQTRVEQGTGYYLRFTTKYPRVSDLANAEDEEVMKLWEGLGYYNRCRNLLTTAREIHYSHNNIFPKTYEGLIALKGIGTYTAAAITSFAYNLPHAVVDGNVIRVLARFFAIKTSVDSTETKKLLENLAQQLLDKRQPGKYNQAIMDFGATVCKPRQPDCASCPLHTNCGAYQRNEVESFPIKNKKTTKKSRGFLYIIYRHQTYYYLKKRNEKDIWKDLHEFSLLEIGFEELTQDIAIKTRIRKLTPAKSTIKLLSGLYKQELSHRTIIARYVVVDLKKPLSDSDLHPVPVHELKQYSFPRITREFMEENAVYFL